MMAPILHTNVRIQAGNIRDMMQSNAPKEPMIELTKELAKNCDPYTKCLIDYYLEIEKQRLDFLKMAGPIFEGVVLPNVSNLSEIESNDVDDSMLESDTIKEVHIPDETRPETRCHIENAVEKLRGSIKTLSFGTVAEKFVHPIDTAARELNVSEATLSLWCRISGIDYWPYRKLKSIDVLIRTIQEIGSVGREDDNGVENAIKMLEDEKSAILKNPNQHLKQSTLVMRRRILNVTSNRKNRKRKLNNEDSKAGTDRDKNRYLVGQELRDKKIRLPFDLVASTFELPMEEAAKRLQVHAKTLQMWCHIHGVVSWPFRKLQRMKKLLANVQGLGHGELFGQKSSQSIIQNLQEEILSIKKNPVTPIRDSTLALMKNVAKKCRKKRR